MTRRALGFDVGKERDYPGLVILDDDGSPCRAIRRAARLPLGLAYPRQVEVVHQSIQAWRPDIVVIDAGGVGNSFFDFVEDEPGGEVSYLWGCTLTSGQHIRIDWERRRIKVPKRSMIRHLQTSIERGLVKPAPDLPKEDREILQEECESLENRIVEATGYVKTEARGSNHDDVLFALMLALVGMKLLSERGGKS
ncbi:MAG: hypothetical protein GDA50_07435 [Alphaproteobacteria bacterium GM202ARS2]|nr:hypothetical protein [Alphaproteobacteria bacterium GM202ARS2]